MAAIDKNIISALRDSLNIELRENLNQEELRGQLSACINSMITGDFNKLLNLLYRLDINEAKLRRLLEENTGTDAGLIVADLIIERQMQKLESRNLFKRKDNEEIDENEKW